MGFEFYNDNIQVGHATCARIDFVTPKLRPCELIFTRANSPVPVFTGLFGAVSISWRWFFGLIEKRGSGPDKVVDCLIEW
jgi:hypothetical protein